MNWKEFEANMKSEVQHHASEMDVDAFWEKVAPKKKKRVPILWFMVPFMVLLLSTVIFLKQNLFNQASVQQYVATEQISSASTKEDVQSESDSPSEVEGHNQLQTQATTIANPKGGNFEVGSVEKNRPFTMGATMKKSLTIQQKASSPGEVIKWSPAPVIPEIDLISESPSANQKATEAMQTAPTLDKKAQHSGLDTVLSFVVKTPLPLSTPPTAINVEPSVTSIKPNRLSQLSLLAQVGVGSWQPRLSSNDSDNLAYQNRKSSETPLESSQVQLLIQPKHGIFKNIQTGVEYTEYHSKMTLTQRWTEQKAKANDLISINYYISGAVDTVKGSSQSTITLERTMVHHNSIRTVAIPIYIQPYTWNATRHLSVRPIAGLLFDFFQQSKGIILAGNSAVQPLEGISNLHKGFGIRGDLQVSFSYTLTRKSALVVTPYASAYFTNLYQKSYAIASKIQNYGLRMGYLQTF